MNLSIIPKPLKEKVVDESKFFEINSNVAVSVNGNSIAYKNLNEFLNKIFGYNLQENQKGAIQLVIDKDNTLGEEGYSLAVNNNGIIIKSISEKGIFYGIQTLKQIVVQFMEKITSKIPLLEIEDKPYYSHRGFMLDSCRHFFRIEDIYKVIDTISLHKINTFHWHLTEDQGWRIEIEKYPELTRIGGRRKETLGDGKVHGGYYTKQEIRDIVKYCSDRFMTVIPEIDLPGHSMAAAAAYNYLTCKGEPIEVSTTFGIKLDIFCAGKESTYNFLYDVLDEITELFPGEYVHLGGDEAPKVRWQECEYCQKVIKDNNLENEEQLQGYFLNKLVEHLKKKDKRVICWNESIYSGILDKSVICQYWSDGKTADRVVKYANEGGQIINSKFTPYYMDYPYAMHSLKKVYNYTPELEGLDDSTKLIGIEAPLWTEYVENLEKIEYMIYPRVSAIAEIAWSDKSKRNYLDYFNRLDNYVKLLDIYKVGYASYKEINPNIFKATKQMIKFAKGMFNRESIKAFRASGKAMKDINKSKKERV